MLKKLVSVAMVVSLLLFSPLAVIDTNFSTPRLATHLIYNSSGNASGVMIAPGRMLTAKHVAVIHSDANPLYVRGKPVKRVIATSKEADLALLEVDLDCPCVPVGNLPDDDSDVLVVGFPVQDQAQMQVLTEGKVSGYNPMQNVLLTSAPAAPGNSGGGLFQRQYGKWKLVGILSSVSLIPIFGMFPNLISHMSYSVDTLSIKGFLRGAV